MRSARSVAMGLALGPLALVSISLEACKLRFTRPHPVGPHTLPDGGSFVSVALNSRKPEPPA